MFSPPTQSERRHLFIQPSPLPPSFLLFLSRGARSWKLKSRFFCLPKPCLMAYFFGTQQLAQCIKYKFIFLEKEKHIENEIRIYPLLFSHFPPPSFSFEEKCVRSQSEWREGRRFVLSGIARTETLANTKSRKRTSFIRRVEGKRKYKKEKDVGIPVRCCVGYAKPRFGYFCALSSSADIVKDSLTISWGPFRAQTKHNTTKSLPVFSSSNDTV